MKDPFGRHITYLRLSVTELCNLRCRYCMPAAGIEKRRHEDMLTEEETVRAVKAAASLGLSKVRLTGWEPLVKKNILSIAEKAAATPGVRELCLTTNGLGLQKLAKPLRAAGVRRVNVSLDTLDPEKYAHITRIGDLNDALRGLEAALDAGFERVKINAVLIRGFNDDEIPALAALTRRWPVDVRFIELMPMGGDLTQGAFLPGDAVLEKLPELEKAPEDGAVARLYRLPGAQGQVGIISPLSCRFCDRCDRVRLTADGRIKPCLHGQAEYPLKGLDEDGMKRQFEAAILAKPPWHGELSEVAPSQAGRPMHRIGG